MGDTNTNFHLLIEVMAEEFELEGKEAKRDQDDGAGPLTEEGGSGVALRSLIERQDSFRET